MTRMFEGEPLDEKRSQHMGKIRGKDTKPELALRRALWRRGLRYRTHNRMLPGTPDISNTARRLAIFVDGCFWHGCPKHFRVPKTRGQYWASKIATNRKTRERVRRSYDGEWRMVEVFECELREKPIEVVDRIVARLGETVKQAT
jgi:DNA mismatch endonuclease (patch repair protein)